MAKKNFLGVWCVVWLLAGLVPVTQAGGLLLALYKSEEGTTATENRIRWHLESELNEDGWHVGYHDLAKGLPRAEQVARADGIITWFRTPTMANVAEYCRWLAGMLARGKRVIVLGNFGAFQEASTREWLSKDVVNGFFVGFGLEYTGKWSDKKESIRIVGMHPMMRVDREDANLRQGRFYLQFRSVDPRNIPLVVVATEEGEVSEAVGAAITPYGAFALDPYFLRYDKDSGEPRFYHDRRRFLRMALAYRGDSGRRLMALYKGSEKTSADENEIKWHLEEALENLGYSVVYHDIDHGPPTPHFMSGVGAVVTWFRGGDMVDAKAYCHWLAEQVYQDRKVLVLGSFGAFREPGGSNWIDSKALGEPFRALGLEYQGDWTGNPDKIALVASDDKIVHADKLQENFARIGHYVRFRPVHPKCRPLVTIRRSDRDDSLSAMVSVSPFGGLVAENYLFANGVDGKLVPLVDLAALAKEAL